MRERIRTLVALARDEVFVPHSRVMLARLGYPILSLAEWERARAEVAPARSGPDLWLVDERRLADVPHPPAGAQPVPILMLTGRRGVTDDDPRIRGAIKRPAGVHELYRLVQQVLEDTPRSAPRVATHLPATCRRRGRQWDAAVVSLSENGCLLRSSEPLPLGSHLELSLALPDCGPLELRAEAAYQLVPDHGLVFSAIDPPSREAISGYVVETIAQPR